MKTLFALSAGLFLVATTFAAETNQLKYLALPLGKNEQQDQKTMLCYGVPFITNNLPLDEGGSAQVDVGGKAERIFLLGMTDKNSPKVQNRRGPSELIRPAVPTDGWADPRDRAVRFFVGDELGQIRLNYEDGTTQIFTLRVGESIWWGRIFYDYQEPFPTDPKLRAALADSLRLYPPAPVEDGNYIAVIKPKDIPIKSITFENSRAKKGTLALAGITIETVDTNRIVGTTVEPGIFTPEFAKFVEEKPLRPQKQDERQAQRELRTLSLALYSSDESFKGPVTPQKPLGYSGPEMSFKGSLAAEVLANAFYYNVQDILDKIDETGMYHTSTSNALSWGGYKGFGTFRENLGRYYDVSYSRDMGRSLQEVTMLGFTNASRRCAEYCLRYASHWETDPSLRFKGEPAPPHWGMFANRPDRGSQENDGQGLTTMFIYKVWQRMPDRDEWLRAHWTEVKGLGDWILWQFDHPEFSQATNDMLYTTGESAANGGHSVYPDCICMYSLLALAQMADSIGKTNSAKQWGIRADKMQAAISKNYIINDPKYGSVWTLDYAGWPNKSTVLGPMIFSADYTGFAPEDDDANWRPINAAAYQRLIETYPPFGFYGQAMGYGQGFVTQSALLLDRMQDATKMLDWTAKEIYDPRYVSSDHFIVPEGVQISPTGEFWYRMGDLGNGVQEAEIVKALRLVIGVDDTLPGRLQFYPRMPYDWDEMAVTKYPVLFEQSGKMETAYLNYKLTRSGKGMKLEISADKELGLIGMRLGPFENQPQTSNLSVNGQSPGNMVAEYSGDSWWAKFTTPVGPAVSK